MYVADATASSGIFAQDYAQNTQVPEELKKELGKNDFLLLLLTELSYQDPLSPVDNKDFIAQMAQFSSLEQMQNVSSQLEKLAESQLQAGLMAQATSLIGRTVTIAQTEGEPVTGEVSKVKIVDGFPQLVIDGETYPLELVNEVA